MPAILTALALVAACAPANRGTAVEPATRSVYVLDGGSGVVTALTFPPADAVRATSTDFPPVPHSVAMAPGPGHTALVVALDADQRTNALRLERRGPGHVATLAVFAASSKAVLLAASGAYAALVYQPLSGQGGAGSTPLCRLAIVRVTAAPATPSELTLRANGGSPTAVHDQPICADGELVGALDAGTHGTRTLAFVALRRYRPARPASEAGSEASVARDTLDEGGGRVVAIDMATGARVATLPVPGVPVSLRLGGAAGVASGGGGAAMERLYVVEDTAGGEDEHLPRSWRLVTLNAASLAVESVQPLAGMVQRLAAGADGRHLYALSEHGRAIRQIDLLTGIDSQLARLPSEALDIAVLGNQVIAVGVGLGAWTIDRRTRQPNAVLVPGKPVAIAAAG